MAPHPRDPRAFVLRPPSRPTTGLWAGKIAAHSAHHRFGSRGYLPHLQVNIWRIGVKGSGSAYRLAIAPALGIALVLGMRVLRPILTAAVTLGV